MIISLDDFLQTPFADFSQKFKKLCEPLFSQYKLNYLDYARFYPDRTCWGLITDPHYVNDLLKRPHYATHAPYLLPNGSFLWAATLPPEFLTETSESYNYYHGLSIVSHTPEYTEIICLAAPAKEIDSLNFFLNERSLIQLFVKYAIEEALTTHKYLKTLRGTLPDHLILSSLQKENPKAKQLIDEIEANAGIRKNHNLMLIGDALVGLSDREKNCITYLRQGFTNKMIAKELDISHRTIEKYFEKIYEKCNLKGRNNLMHELMK